MLTIADNGCGFVPEDRDPAPAAGEHLGLLTMRERAARLRGRLALISSPGARHDHRGRGATDGGVTLVMSANPIRVLCVDDHRLMREGIARIVGVQPDMTVVAEASDGEEAVEQFLRFKPDVTLMDLEMPTMNGVQAIQAIREQAARRADRRPDDVSRGRGYLSRRRGRCAWDTS